MATISTFAFAASAEDRTNIAERHSVMNYSPAVAARQQRQIEARRRFCAQLEQEAKRRAAASAATPASQVSA